MKHTVYIIVKHLISLVKHTMFTALYGIKNDGKVSKE